MEYKPTCVGYFRVDTCPTAHPTPTYFSKKKKNYNKIRVDGIRISEP